MTDIKIPPAVLEAGARAIAARNENLSMDALSAACLAMLEAWPGKDIVGYGPPFYGIDLILPLAQENSNE